MLVITIIWRVTRTCGLWTLRFLCARQMSPGLELCQQILIRVILSSTDDIYRT